MTIEITPELLTVMRETYGHRCRVCGDQLSMQDSRALVFACSPLEDDPDNPGRLRIKAGRLAVDDHYSASRLYFSREHLSPQPVVLALIDAYEELLKRERELRDAWERLAADLDGIAHGHLGREARERLAAVSPVARARTREEEPSVSKPLAREEKIKRLRAVFDAGMECEGRDERPRTDAELLDMWENP